MGFEQPAMNQNGQLSARPSYVVPTFAPVKLAVNHNAMMAELAKRRTGGRPEPKAAAVRPPRGRRQARAQKSDDEINSDKWSASGFSSDDDREQDDSVFTLEEMPNPDHPGWLAFDRDSDEEVPEDELLGAYEKLSLTRDMMKEMHDCGFSWDPYCFGPGFVPNKSLVPKHMLDYRVCLQNISSFPLH